MRDMIDIENWDRKHSYRLFLDYKDPYFSLTTSVDVTRLLAYSKQHSQSFFLINLWAALKAANATEAFRLRLCEEGVERHPTVHGGSTLLLPDQTFTFFYFEYKERLEDFLAEASPSKDHAMKDPIHRNRDDRSDMIYFSTLPWIPFTSFKNPQKAGTLDSIPKIVFGKYTTEGSAIKMPVAIEVHHALIDGYHVAQFLEAYQQNIENL